MKLSLFIACAFLLSFSAHARPVIMLTGYWPPTNEMLREFSPNISQNHGSWAGENWEGLGYDVKAYFPEFDKNDSRGHGDFEVDYSDTKADLERITAEVQPLALLSFGQGAGPWEIEQNFPDFWNQGATLHSTLPMEKISAAINAGGKIRAWIDTDGDPGNFLCGYMSYIGAQYKVAHSEPSLPNYVQAQGFIHVGVGYESEVYREALHATLRALIQSLK
jgi:hypothetical protein